MPMPGEELASIDFESLIGGPLIAVVNAQAQAAITTVNFIKTVGFKEPDDEFEFGDDSSTAEPIYVSFIYPKETKPYEPAVEEAEEVVDADGNVISPAVEAKEAVPATYEDHELRVPILTMLPIPYLRIEETTVDFNAKINMVTYKKVDSSVKFTKEAEAKGGFLFFGSAKLKTSFSYQKNTQAGARVERTYTMAVHVRAVQDEMPGGMERILGILEDAIVAKPSGVTDSAHPVDRNG
jgi:hypothetical protein